MMKRRFSATWKCNTVVGLLLAVGLLGIWGCTNQTRQPMPTGESLIQHANDADFDRVVLASPVPVLVDFYADWCGPCQQLAPVLEELARETTAFKIVKVNVDQSRELSQRYGIQSIPNLIVFKNGVAKAHTVGLVDKAKLKSMLAM